MRSLFTAALALVGAVPLLAQNAATSPPDGTLLGRLRYPLPPFDRLTPAAQRPPAWHVEIHQFRIEARTGREGRPTPEGMHRDGVDWVLVLLVSRVNIASGETSIGDFAKRPLGSFTLTDPLDAAITDDNRVYHGVTPVTPLDPARPGHRDVLVATFRRE